MAGPYSYLTRTFDTLNADMAPGATSATLANGNFGTPVYKMILTIDPKVSGKAADFECTVSGTSITSMVRLNGPDVAHISGAIVIASLVDEHLSGLQDGSSWTTTAVLKSSAQITSTITTSSTTPVQATGLSTTFQADGLHTYEIGVKVRSLDNATANNLSAISLWDGIVGSGTKIDESVTFSAASNSGNPAMLVAVVTPGAGSKTYNVGFSSPVTGTTRIYADSTAPARIWVKKI